MVLWGFSHDDTWIPVPVLAHVLALVPVLVRRVLAPCLAMPAHASCADLEFLAFNYDAFIEDLCVQLFYNEEYPAKLADSIDKQINT